jgi:hypothetical protein
MGTHRDFRPGDDDGRQIMDICRDTMSVREAAERLLHAPRILPFKLVRLAFLLLLTYTLSQRPLTASPLGETKRLSQADMLSLLLFALASQLGLSASSPTSEGRRVGPAERSWLGGYAYSRKSPNRLLARGSVPSGWVCVAIFFCPGERTLTFPRHVRRKFVLSPVRLDVSPTR